MKQTLATALLAAAVALTTGCEQKKSKFQKVSIKAPPVEPCAPTAGDAHTNTDPHGNVPPTPSVPTVDIDSKEILARTQPAQTVFVKHLMVSWKELANVLGPNLDARAKERDNKAAAELAKQLADKIRTNPGAVDQVITESSEFPGPKSTDPKEVESDGSFIPEFNNLALRLNMGEVGIVKSMYGYHVLFRVPAPPLDPLENAEQFGREPGKGPVLVKHILIGYKEALASQDDSRPVDPRAKARDKAAADKIVQDLLAKVNQGGDMSALMKEHSEDPGSKDTGKEYEVDAKTPFVAQFKKLALRLKEGEAGLAKTEFGWHVIKRVPPPPPPPPDKLESNDILARAPVTEKSKVKHILLSDVTTKRNGQDPRGEKRTHAELETLINKTVADLNAKKPIEPMMKELSEDPGSAASGTSYDVTPDAGLVPPFKALGLRLKVGEVGVVKTQFGYHIIQRTE